MTSPPLNASLPYLHIDDFSVHVPEDTDLVRLTKELSIAAAEGKLHWVQVVDEAGNTVHALVVPARARIIVASEAPVIVPRKNLPVST